MKKIKISEYWRRGPRYEYIGASRFQIIKHRIASFFRKVITVSVVGIVLTVAWSLGGYFTPNTIVSVQEKIVYAESQYPVLERIAQCESHNNHFCTDELIKAKLCAPSEKGQVLVRANNNKTIDVGRYQINVYYWGAEATAQGLNLFDEEDNKKFAIWLYKNKGTEDWAASRKCWYK